MVKTTAVLLEELKDYVNPGAKIKQMIKSGELIRIVRGLYETDKTIPGYYLAQVTYGPSYLSFEFALHYHSLIPEAVYNFTSATFEKKKAKQFDTPFGTFTYRDVPSTAYPMGLILQSENGYGFLVASPEKAICDQLYKTPPLANQKEFENLLFQDLRIDETEFFGLNGPDLLQIASCFHTQNHKLLSAFVKRNMKNGSNHRSNAEAV